MLPRLNRLLRNRTVWRLAALLGTVAVLIACWTPANRLPQAALGPDKVLHLMAFMALGFFWHRAGLRARSALLLCLILAIGTEIGQTWLAGGRSGEVLDAVADMLGALLGVVLSIRLGRPSKAAPAS